MDFIRLSVMDIKTGCWFGDLPAGHTRGGISRGIPRRTTAGYRVYRKLAPGTWFNSVSAEEYYYLYRSEILAPLDPRVIASELIDLAKGSIPVMVCYERTGGPQWCHRAMVAEWLEQNLGRDIPELGFETAPKGTHPLMPVLASPADLLAFVGYEASINGELHRVVGLDPNYTGRVIVAVGDRQFPVGLDILRAHFKRA
jgi:hypothetical protein